jgi:hypothetical protein
MSKALDEVVGGITELDKGSSGNTSYFRQDPERPMGSCASWGTKGLICLFRLVFVLGGNPGCSAVHPPSQSDRLNASDSIFKVGSF